MSQALAVLMYIGMYAAIGFGVVGIMHLCDVRRCARERRRRVATGALEREIRKLELETAVPIEQLIEEAEIAATKSALGC